jgi:hypothetical protein
MPRWMICHRARNCESVSRVSPSIAASGFVTPVTFAGSEQYRSDAAGASTAPRSTAVTADAIAGKEKIVAAGPATTIGNTPAPASSATMMHRRAFCGESPPGKATCVCPRPLIAATSPARTVAPVSKPLAT